MGTLRKCLSWLFAFTSLLCLQIALWPILIATFRQHTVVSHASLIVAVVFSALAVVFGMAWWTTFQQKSARGWGMAASIIYILVVVLPATFFSRSLWSHFAVVLAIGAAGLIAFSRPYKTTHSMAESQAVAGDGTSNLANKLAELITFLLCLATYLWWFDWARAKGVPVDHSVFQQTMIVLIIVLAIATFHELGHTAMGLALGMRLRAFLIGPFQWRIRDGKWNFHFNPTEILSVTGGTGVVPATADFPRWGYLCMLAAGPMVTFITGVCALWAGVTEIRGATLPARASVLFGTWSLVICFGNLVPFHTKGRYSDGAVIYQLVSGGPWGDFHRAMGLIGSSLVTPLRPKDYDIEMIRRAARSIAHGPQALLLRLYAYTYFLDWGRILEAGQALREAESIYHESASDVPAELLTVFVFGSAYVRGDAVVARQWWTQMEAKKAVRPNTDYWMAAAALHWIEGNLNEANLAWDKGHALAQQFPQAGAYEFDRYCCSLLRKALDEASAVRSASQSNG